MSSVMDIYQQLCTEDRFPSAEVTDPKRRKQRRDDLKTALRYLAASYDTTPEQLTLTDDLEATCRETLKHYLTAQGKGKSTIRNAGQNITQYLNAYHALQQTP